MAGVAQRRSSAAVEICAYRDEQPEDVDAMSAVKIPALLCCDDGKQQIFRRTAPTSRAKQYAHLAAYRAAVRCRS